MRSFWHLEKGDFFDGIEECKERFLRSAQRIELKKNDIVFFEGDAGGACFYVASGLLRIFCVTEAGKESTFFLRTAGEIFGLSEVLQDLPRKVSAQALAASVIFRLDREAFDRCRELGLGQPVYVAELDLRKMQEILTAPVKAAELPQFPGSSRDAAMELPLSTPNADIVKAVESAREKLLVSYSCFDVFTDPSGEKLPADRKSIAYTFLYRDPAKTLTAAEVDAAHQRVLKALTDKVKGLSFR